MLTNDRQTYRQTFLDAWEKHQLQQPLLPLETHIIDVIQQHPEYQPLLVNDAAMQMQEFALEDNPFLHMSLHLAIHDQVRSNRPVGITPIFQACLEKYQQHDIEHLMMECLVHVLRTAQQNGKMVDEANYLELLRSL